jgi:uncharacterized protein with PQ loop repeat
MTSFIGWAAAAILIATISSQVYKQWNDETSRGVSIWLFLGQIAANGLFLTYAILVDDPVFIAANGVLLLVSFVGLYIKRRHTLAARAA